MRKLVILVFINLIFVLSVMAQNKKAGPHDFGKMWTFENPPTKWLKEKYDFTPDEKWFADVRKAALRMPNGCSASFVSPDGLIMTNHHCSRDVALGAQKEGENMLKNGFFADERKDERNLPGLYFEQLIEVDDITDQMNNLMNTIDEKDYEKRLDLAYDSITARYEKKVGWGNLRLHIVSFYSGAKYSMYGYEKFENIKLVAIPETDVAFFGGDADNFTYPRYDVDFTFWRAYDKDGNPVNTSENYYKFNINGAENEELVFVVGNPWSTERYRTVAQLDWDRQYRYPPKLDFLRSVLERLQEQYDANPNENLMNMIFGLANGEKAYSGIQKGLMNPELFQRKIDIENQVRKDYKGEDYWLELENIYKKLAPHSWALDILSPNPMKGSTMMLVNALYKYEEALKKGAKQYELDDIKDQISGLTKSVGTEDDIFYLTLMVELLERHIYEGNTIMKELMQGDSPSDYVKKLMNNSLFFKGDEWKKYFDLKADDFYKANDMLLLMSRALVPEYHKAVKIFEETAVRRKELQSNIAKEYFKHFGDILPPDATSTLRISDGIVKNYKYNGTIAPYKTSFYGMYNRNVSFDNKFPWHLPERWQNPPREFLKLPLDFVSTNDIIGGNSGSPIINKNKEVVGLIFDGNIESLPGNFIFDEEYNRSVSVHAGGIYGCLKYIYNAKRLYEELVPEKKN